MQQGDDDNKEVPVKRKYPCKECNFVFNKQAHLLRHQLIHNDERPHVCTICHKGYRTQFHLNRHMTTHSGEKTFKCSYEGCNVACMTDWNLKRHVKRTHCGLFKCGTCGKEFKKNKLLQQHLSTEHKQSTICCEFPGCAQIFSVASKMRHHMKIHNERGYLCTVIDCHEKFSLWSECRMHTAKCKMREVNCDVCGKTFKERSNMKAHRKIHSEEREVFTCSYEGCGRFYTKNYNLKAHVQSFHLNNRPHSCPKNGCNKSFHFPHLLRNHLANIHQSNETGDDEKSPPEKCKKRNRRINMSTISAITGHIPELAKKMTSEEIKCYVDDDGDDDKSMSGSESCVDTTQEKMPHINISDCTTKADHAHACNSGTAAASDAQSTSLDEYETITELVQINPYIYKPVQRLVRRPHFNQTSSSHTITSPNAQCQQQFTPRFNAARKVSESSIIEQDECMIINSVDLPEVIRTEQDECMVAFNNRFKHMQSTLSSSLSDVEMSSCHLQSIKESESVDSDGKKQNNNSNNQVQCVA